MTKRSGRVGAIVALGGAAIAFAGLLSYFTFFYRFPALRDFPVVNLPIILAGACISVVGTWWAWGRESRWLPRSIACVGLALSLAVGGLFCTYIFVWSYQLPDAARALPVGAEAPDFSLPNQDGEIVTLESLRGQPVLLLFYRGHW